MQRRLETLYAVGRLAFGAGLLAAPETVGRVLLGEQAGEPTVRGVFRFYGTRDTVLGLGTLRASAGGGDVGAWVAGGIASDLLDAGVMLAEWPDLPREKRAPGIAAALGAAAAGIMLLARR